MIPASAGQKDIRDREMLCLHKCDPCRGWVALPFGLDIINHTNCQAGAKNATSSSIFIVSLPATASC